MRVVVLERCLKDLGSPQRPKEHQLEAVCPFSVTAPNRPERATKQAAGAKPIAMEINSCTILCQAFLIPKIFLLASLNQRIKTQIQKKAD